MNGKAWWLAAALAVAGAAQAQGHSHGPGPAAGGCPMMDQSGMMMGHSGMMMGQPGMMGQGMMGPGMMGQGMMMGPGMGGMAALNLTEQQRRDIGRIQDDHRRRHWDLMGKIMEQQSKLRDLYAAETWDEAAISKVYDQIADLNKQIVRSEIQARNQIYQQLAPDQRSRFRGMGP